MHWDLQKVHEVLSTLPGSHGGGQSGKNHSTLRVHLLPPLTLSSPPNYQTTAANRVHEQPCTPFQTCISSTSSQESSSTQYYFSFFFLGGGGGGMTMPNSQILLTPSLPQPVKCLGWKLHERACKQYIFWSYNICSQCFAYSRLSFHMPVQKRKQKGGLRVWNFTLPSVVFKRHNGSEKVKPDNNGDKGHISCCTSTSANHSQACAACRCSYCE